MRKTEILKSLKGEVNSSFKGRCELASPMYRRCCEYISKEDEKTTAKISPENNTSYHII